MDERKSPVTDLNPKAMPPHRTAAGKNDQRREQRRTQRLDELTDKALDELDPLRANLKAAAAQLFDIGYRLGDEVRNSIGSGRSKRKPRRESAGEVSTLMLVHRQITRYVQLDQQWTSERTSGDEAERSSN